MAIPKPTTLGPAPSFGFGDGIGLAAAGHVEARRLFQLKPMHNFWLYLPLAKLKYYFWPYQTAARKRTMVILRNWFCCFMAMLTYLVSTGNALCKDTPTASAERASPIHAKEPQLPRVLLIGDSISIGYAKSCQRCLSGIAKVSLPEENCRSTAVGIENLKKWLGSEQWDVIHFNWGLHDMKYVDPTTLERLTVDHPNAKEWVSVSQYENNLRKLVFDLKKTKATLIWCTTTPVPEKSVGRVAGDEIRYNAVALKVMEEHGIVVNDLCSFARQRLAEIQRPHNVHFTADGSRVLGEQVAKKIEDALSSKAQIEAPKPERPAPIGDSSS